MRFQKLSWYLPSCWFSFSSCNRLSVDLPFRYSARETLIHTACILCAYRYKYVNLQVQKDEKCLFFHDTGAQNPWNTLYSTFTNANHSRCNLSSHFYSLLQFKHFQRVGLIFRISLFSFNIGVGIIPDLSWKCWIKLFTSRTSRERFVDEKRKSSSHHRL